MEFSDDIYIPSQEHEIETFIDGSILTVSDAPWPFHLDLISIVLVITQ
jgi:UDP-N-acetylglucosamine 1-carboxyvinyltransferase